MRFLAFILSPLMPNYWLEMPEEETGSFQAVWGTNYFGYMQMGSSKRTFVSLRNAYRYARLQALWLDFGTLKPLGVWWGIKDVKN